MRVGYGIVLLLGSIGLESDARAAESGFYAGVDLGVTEPAVGKSDGFLVTFTHAPGILFQVTPRTVSPEGADAGAGALVGYRINRYLAAEFAYTDFGSIDIREEYVINPFPFPISNPLELTVNLTSRVAGPSVNFLGILPLTEQFEVFARTGLLFADQYVSRTPGGISDSNAEELWVMGAGFDVAIARGWSARFAFESVDGLRKTQFTGPIRIERFVLGVTYGF